MCEVCLTKKRKVGVAGAWGYSVGYCVKGMGGLHVSLSGELPLIVLFLARLCTVAVNVSCLPSKYSECKEFILLVQSTVRCCLLPAPWEQGYYVLLCWDVSEANQKVPGEADKGLQNESKPNL
jgi:uncharacterized membrane protein (Fun14 family)